MCMLFKNQNCSFLQNKKGGDPRPVNLMVSEKVWGIQSCDNLTAKMELTHQ